MYYLHFLSSQEGRNTDFILSIYDEIFVIIMLTFPTFGLLSFVHHNYFCFYHASYLSFPYQNIPFLALSKCIYLYYFSPLVDYVSTPDSSLYSPIGKVVNVYVFLLL